MVGATALSWDKLMATCPVGNTFKATIPDEPDAYEITCAKLGAEKIFNCPPNRRLHLAMFFKEMRYMIGLSAVDLKEFLLEASACDASFSLPYSNMAKGQLAYYEWSSARWNFTTQLSGLPAALKKEKEKQLREAAIARGEVVPDEGAAAAPAKKKFKVTDFMAQADRLSPCGISLPAALLVPPPATAPAAAPAAVPRGGVQGDNYLGAFNVAATMSDEE